MWDKKDVHRRKRDTTGTDMIQSDSPAILYKQNKKKIKQNTKSATCYSVTAGCGSASLV